MNNPILMCENCNSEIGIIDTDRIRSPIKGDMFLPKKPDFPPPFRSYWGFQEMQCPCCKRRPFYYRNAFTVSHNGLKTYQGYIIKDCGSSGLEPVMCGGEDDPPVNDLIVTHEDKHDCIGCREAQTDYCINDCKTKLMEWEKFCEEPKGEDTLKAHGKMVVGTIARWYEKNGEVDEKAKRELKEIGDRMLGRVKKKLAKQGKELPREDLKDIVLPVNAAIEPPAEVNACPYCDFVAKTAVGLKRHIHFKHKEAA